MVDAELKLNSVTPHNTVTAFTYINTFVHNVIPNKQLTSQLKSYTSGTLTSKSCKKIFKDSRPSKFLKLRIVYIIALGNLIKSTCLVEILFKNESA